MTITVTCKNHDSVLVNATDLNVAFLGIGTDGKQFHLAFEGNLQCSGKGVHDFDWKAVGIVQ